MSALSMKRKPALGITDRAAKRIASGNATPSTATSGDDEYSGNDSERSNDDPEQEEMQESVDMFDLDYKPKKSWTGDAVTQLFPRYCDFSHELDFKSDHEDRPLWIDPKTAKIILESFSPLAKQAQDFLITIAEPQSRPWYLHEYSLTVHSLYAAVSVGLGASDIISTLDKFSKSSLPANIIEYILKATQAFGKVKLVLKHNSYFIESSEASILQRLLKDEIIGPCRIDGSTEITQEKAPSMAGLVIPGTKNASTLQKAAGQQLQKLQLQEQAVGQDDEDEDEDGGINDKDMFAAFTELEYDEDEESERVHSFQIPAHFVETVQRRCLSLGFPIAEEYDFRNDEVNANLEIDLRPSARIRDYQEKSLSKMFGNGRAKSGIIVLPCGAGKTLVGITAACTIKKGVVVLCTSSMSVVQWRNEFLKWSNISANDIAIFTAEHKDRFPGSTGIIISTYSMVSQTRARAYDSQKMMDFLQKREWGLMILDEVHVVPAKLFRKATKSILTHSKLGLTATLLREDDKIGDLNFLIGPKLYEANWMELSQQGHIAKVQCAEVWCPMTAEFYSEYLRESARKRMLLYIMNPRKFQACQFLIDYHERRGDKIIVFSDNVFALERYARKLNKAYIFGGTPQAERLRILENFQHNENVNTIFLSKIGDTSLDLPEATCLIQISSHYGSRRQEAQRLGRILRAKRRNDEGFNAFFYSLVSKDTNEMYYSSKRQAFLVDQGYAFKIITHLQGIESLKDLAFTTAQERRELLQDVMLQNELFADVETIDGDLYSKGYGVRVTQKSKSVIRRTAGALSELSGGQDMAYVEYNRSRNKDLKVRGSHNAFIKKLKRDNERRRTAQ